MYCVIYEFIIKPENSEAFRAAWSDLTHCIKLECSSLGSRLHRTDDEARYIAYAQWQSKDQFLAAQASSSKNRQTLSNTMQQTLLSSRIVEQLEVCDSLLESC